MTNAHDLARGHARLLPLIEYALRDGWTVERLASGSLMFVKPGRPPLHIGAFGHDDRAAYKARTPPHPADRQPTALHGHRKTGGRDDG